MSFEELWKQVKELRILPDTAIAEVPSILTSETKKKLMKYTPVEVAEIVAAAIDEINHSSVETVNSLVRKHI